MDADQFLDFAVADFLQSSERLQRESTAEYTLRLAELLASLDADTLNRVLYLEPKLRNPQPEDTPPF